MRPVDDITENEVTEREPPFGAPHGLLFGPPVRLAYRMKALNDKDLSLGPSLMCPPGGGIEAASLGSTAWRSGFGASKTRK